MVKKRRAVQLLVALLSVVLIAANGLGGPKSYVAIDDSVTQEREKVSEVIELLMAFFKDIPLPQGGFMCLVTATGEVNGVQLTLMPQPGIRISFTVPGNVANALGLVSRGGWETSLLVFEAVAYGDVGLLTRLQEAVQNLKVMAGYPIADIGICVARNLLSDTQREVGDEIIQELGAVDSLDRIEELADKRALLFIAHDPRAFFPEFIEAIREGRLDAKDRLFLFFLCGKTADPLGPEWVEEFESIQDELIYTHQAAGIVYFTDYIHIEAVRAVLRSMLKEYDTPLLPALLKALFEELQRIKGSVSEPLLMELFHRLRIEFGYKPTGWC